MIWFLMLLLAAEAIAGFTESYVLAVYVAPWVGRLVRRLKRK